MNGKKRKTKANPAPSSSCKSSRFKPSISAIILFISLCLSASTHFPYSPSPKWLDSQIVLEDLISPFELLQKMSFQNAQILKSSQFKKKVIGMGYRNKFNRKNQSIFSMVVIFEIQNPKDYFLPMLYLGVEYVPENDPVRVGRFGLKKFIMTNVLQSPNLAQVQSFFGFSDLNRFNFAPVSGSIKYTPKVHRRIRRRYLPPTNPYIEPVQGEGPRVSGAVTSLNTVPMNIPVNAPVNIPVNSPVTASGPKSVAAPALDNIFAPVAALANSPAPAPGSVISAVKRAPFQAAKVRPRYSTTVAQKGQKLVNANMGPKKFPAFTRPASSLGIYTPRKVAKSKSKSKSKQIVNRKSRQPVRISNQKPKNVINARPVTSKLLPIVQSSKIRNRKYRPFDSLPRFQQPKARNEAKLKIRKQIKPMRIQKKRNSISKILTQNTRKSSQKTPTILKNELVNLKKASQKFKSVLADFDEDDLISDSLTLEQTLESGNIMVGDHKKSISESTAEIDEIQPSQEISEEKPDP